MRNKLFHLVKVKSLKTAIIRRSQCETAVPGNRVTVIGIYSIRKAAKQGRGKDKGAVGVRMPYLRVVGIQVRSCNYSFPHYLSLY